MNSTLGQGNMFRVLVPPDPDDLHISVFVPISYCLDDCSFVVWTEIRTVDSSSSILLSQDCCGLSGSFAFPYHYS